MRAVALLGHRIEVSSIAGRGSHFSILAAAAVTHRAARRSRRRCNPPLLDQPTKAVRIGRNDPS
jgi:hypothetical protein